jgi:L-ascorbate metabolism protein UlaG (beta-lactamase superfamily)
MGQPVSLSITWLGHATFLLRLPTGQRIVTDPWLGNPKCPEAWSKPEALRPVDLILASHAHADHIADAQALARATGAPLVCIVELGRHFRNLGVQHVREMNIGGTQALGDLRITLTPAVHSSSTVLNDQIVTLGEPTGFVLRAPETPTIYFAGDTALFGDMKLIAALYEPAIAFLPIGDHYTMGPDAAAKAAQWLGVRQVVPMHWGTFPVLTGTPTVLRQHLAGTGIDVLELAPGETAE